MPRIPSLGGSRIERALTDAELAAGCVEGEGVDALSKASINPLDLVGAIGRMLGHNRRVRVGLAEMREIVDENKRRK